jgi:hypothetical protein
MKKLMTLAITAVVAFPFLAFGQTEGYYDRSFTRLSYVKGDVYIQRAQDLGYEQGEVNLVVVEGDKLGTREGRAEIQLGRGNILRLDRETQIDIAGLPGRDGDPTKIHLLNGSVFFRVRDVDQEKNLQLHTPDASFYILEAGLFRVDVQGNHQTVFSVLSGQAEAAGEDGSVLVQSGEMITAANGRWNGGPTGLLARRDDFDSWNESRDGLYARQLSRTYLPASYAEYDYELSDYGRWSYESEYGYVWVPTVYDAGWRPYYNGRWVWYPIIGWTWISYEPWGWCTSHYGRWGWRFGLGWYWIPMNYWSWGPAWVHWYSYYDYVGWCPLSYWGYPAVICNNRFHGRHNDGWDDRGDYRDYSRSLTVVRRDQLQYRGISRVALNERSGADLGRISLRAAQPDLRPSLDRNPDISRRAQEVLNRGALRNVGPGFSPSIERPSPSERQDFRAPEIRKSESGGFSRGGGVVTREYETSRVPYTSGRVAEREPQGTLRPMSERLIRPQIGERSADGSERNVTGGIKRETMKEYPTRSSSSDRNSSPVIRSSSSLGSLAKRSFSSPPRNELSSSRFDGFPSRSSTSGSTSSRVIRSYSSSGNIPSRFYSTPSRSSSYSSSRLNNAPSRSYSSSSRDSYSSGRSFSGSSLSRSYSAPSRSSSFSGRSHSSSSRSYSSPSRSSSGSRSYSSPSRSSSSSSRSSSSSSRSSSSSSSSRSSSHSSSGSKSSGSIHRR